LSLTESEQRWRFDALVVSLNRREVKNIMENQYEIKPVNPTKLPTGSTEASAGVCYLIDYHNDDDFCGIDY
jgi:hypothetical protein